MNGINEVQKEQARDAVKPQVNLVGAFTNTGLSGSVSAGDNPITASQGAMVERLNLLSLQSGLTPLPAVSFGGLPDSLVGGYGATLSNLFGGNYRSVSVGLAMDFNIRNTTAEANLAQAAIAERRLKLQRAQAEQTIGAQVRNAMQAMQTARQRIAAAEAGARAAGQKLESETRLFQTGESTNFLVLTRQNEYADARHRLTVAKLDYNKATVRLAQALGATLRDHGIQLR
jgi:hydrophobic/amphiphilic exporter-1 (mainly G- bacteria), HAE1 family